MKKKPGINSIFPAGLKFNVKSHDIEEMREQAAFWSFEQNQLGRGKFEGKTLAYHTRNLQLSLTYRSVGVSIYGQTPPETTIISFPLYPVNTIYFRGQLVRKHQLLSLNHSDELDLHTLFPSTLLTVAISTKVLEKQAFSLRGRSFVKSCSSELPLMKPSAYDGCSNFLISQLKDLNRRNCLLAKIDEDVVEKELIETIFLGMDFSEVPLEKKAARLSLVRRAEEYIRDNLKSELSISDLCRAMGTSARTLHLGFRERLGISPKAYNQILRLNEVHKELLLNRSGKTVTETAMDWGFLHLGRFSEQYSRLFGELPSATNNKAS